LVEVTDNRSLFDALGFKPSHAFAKRTGDTLYYDFAPALPDRSAIRPLVESDPGVQKTLAIVRQQLAEWWRFLQNPSTAKGARASCPCFVGGTPMPQGVLQEPRWTEHSPRLAKLEKTGPKPAKAGRGAASAPSPELVAARKNLQPVFNLKEAVRSRGRDRTAVVSWVFHQMGPSRQGSGSHPIGEGVSSILTS
jgi:hypothetical protein